MNSILCQLYEMKMMSSVQLEAKEGVQQKRKNECFQRHQKSFDRLRNLDKAIYDDMVSILEEQLAWNKTEAEDMFCYGVSVGTQLMVEVFTIA